MAGDATSPGPSARSGVHCKETPPHLKSPILSPAVYFCKHIPGHYSEGAEEGFSPMSKTTTTLVKTEAELGDHSFGIKRSGPKGSARLVGSTGSHLTPSRRCPVCFRTPCPLNSHKQYARSRSLVEARTSANTRESSSSLSRSSSEAASERSDGRHHARLVQIGATDIDSFIHFPLPKGVKADVHQLFRDCKPTTFSCVLFSLHSVAYDPSK